MSLFADDTKLFRRIISESDREILQKDLDNIAEWADKWKMEFNVGKCKIMHLGRLNPGYSYSMGGSDLEVV